MKREQNKSRLLEAVHETAQDLHKLGFIDSIRDRAPIFLIESRMDGAACQRKNRGSVPNYPCP